MFFIFISQHTKHLFFMFRMLLHSPFYRFSIFGDVVCKAWFPIIPVTVPLPFLLILLFPIDGSRDCKESVSLKTNETHI